MKQNQYIYKTPFGKSIVNLLISLLTQHEKFLTKAPLAGSYTLALFWIFAIIARLTLEKPIISVFELSIGAALHIALTLSYNLLKSKTSFLVLLTLSFSQALVMGLNKSLILFGALWLIISSAMFIGFFQTQIKNGLKSLLDENDNNPTEVSNEKESEKLLKIVGAFFLALVAFSYFQPGLGDNEQVFFATAHLSSFYDNLYDKFSKVWEMKPIFHRAYVYLFYEIATIFSDFQDKNSFETTINITYGLWCGFIISVGIIAGRKKLKSFFKIPLWQILLFALLIQGVMSAKAFEAEEMVYGFSILSFGLLVSGNPLTVFLAPFIFLYITLLKGVTLLIPVSLTFFALLIFKFRKSEYIAFITGTAFSISLLTLLFIKYPIFLHEYSNAGEIQQATTFLLGLVRLIISVGAISRSLYNNPFVISGIILSLPLLFVLKKKKDYKSFAALLVVWLGTLFIPIVLGKAFTYYALPITIASFFTILISTSIYKEILSDKKLYQPFRSGLIASIITILIMVLTLGKSMVIISSLFPIAASILMLVNIKKRWFTSKQLLLLILISTLLMYTTHRRPWNTRKASTISDKSQIVNFLKHDNSEYQKEQMLYLSYGKEAYHLGMYTPNRYFYTLIMRRDIEMEGIINSDESITKPIKKSALQLRNIITNSEVMKQTKDDILNYRGSYILHSKRGWCDLSFYPDISNFINNKYTLVLETPRHELYKIKE